MKATITLLALTATALLTTSCVGGPGSIYTNIGRPGHATGEPGNHRGEASSINILGLIAIGDGSIAKAKQNGKISAVSTVDVNSMSVLGLFSRDTTIVTGH